MGYYCLRCKMPVEIHEPGNEYHGVRCPYCGYRALKKERPVGMITRVKAI
ncbi:MAG: DNA-directed RNA polymerase subunit P [Methanophagales archaeon]|nr:DNA-directed RNA polymerase subunit P [Methanophagales archaeon]